MGIALVFWLILVFVTGAAVGSFLNVAIARLPLEKSLLWPNSRCGNCLQAIDWYDNLPLISYLWLRGRCRTCGQQFGIGYLLVELGTAFGFVGLFWWEVVENIHGWPGFPWARWGTPPWSWIIGFAWHALLFAFLFAAAVCDLKSREIPLSLTLTGTVIGLVGSALMPWPWPHSATAANTNPKFPLWQGVYPWPFWLENPGWCEPGTWVMGLLTGVIGALVGTLLLRAIGFLFSTGLGKEALGLGDADLMMMAGAFLGWQVVVVAFFLSSLPALVLGILQLAINKDNAQPFGPSLAFSVLGTCLAWKWLGNLVQGYFFLAEMLIAAVVLCALMLFTSAVVMRKIREGRETPT